jgi:hypothetical protein
MNERGSVYLIVLVLLLTVTTAAILWQKQYTEYTNYVSTSWARVRAEQNALSGLEYALAMLKEGGLPETPIDGRLTTGSFRVDWHRKGTMLMIESRGVTYYSGKQFTVVHIREIPVVE